MWSSWFPNFSKRTSDDERFSKSLPNANLQKRLLSLQLSSKPIEKEQSPMLKELQNRPNKVKGISRLYEANITAFNGMNNSVIIDRSGQKTPLSSRFVPAKVLEETKENRPEQQNDKLTILMRQFVDMDAEYIRHMKLLIDNYVKRFETLPALQLKNEQVITDRVKQELFGSIEYIFTLHKIIFHPMLIMCRRNFKLLATKISKMCSTGDFTSYIVFAMDEKECEHRRNVYYKTLMEEIFQNCGVSYDVKPIQQLQKYHQIMVDILEGLRENQAAEEELCAMEKAVHDMSNVLSKINSAKSIGDVKL